MILTVEDVSKKYKLSKSWIYKRTGPKAKLKPRLPILPGFGQPRFDEDELHKVLCGPRSLKTKEVRKSIATNPSTERRLERLWE